MKLERRGGQLSADDTAVGGQLDPPTAIGSIISQSVMRFL